MKCNSMVLFSFSLYAVILPKSLPLNFPNQFVGPLFKLFMKKFLLCLSVIAVVMLLLTSCAASKRDCQGVKHYKTKGGFYM
jgi:hypothetical protein